MPFVSVNFLKIIPFTPGILNWTPLALIFGQKYLSFFFYFVFILFFIYLFFFKFFYFFYFFIFFIFLFFFVKLGLSPSHYYVEI